MADGELLKAELEHFRTDFMARAPGEVREAMTRADLELAASELIARAVKAGDQAPDFALPEARGGSARLSGLAAQGPVVVSFYRGGWCPYCTLELKALQRIWPDLRRVGASLVAVSPQTRSESLKTARQNSLTFPLLSDAGAAVAEAYGVVYDLAGNFGLDINAWRERFRFYTDRFPVRLEVT